MKVLVTGCNGFAGKYLCENLQRNGNEVYGVDLQESPFEDYVTYKQLDITDYADVKAEIESWRINAVYHLAALANPRAANEHPLQAVRINTLATVNFIDFCRLHSNIRLLVVGSSEEYKVKKSESIEYLEKDDLESHNIYGASKIAAEIIGKEYVRQYGCKIFFTRSFNHTGPGQTPDYVLSDFAKQCADIKNLKQKSEIHVGNIEIARDFLDVRDVVVAYEKIINFGMAGETYNVCSGRSYKLRDLLNHLISLTGLPDVRIIVDKEKVRSSEPIMIRGNSDKITADTDWRPTYPMESTLNDLFSYWE